MYLKIEEIIDLQLTEDVEKRMIMFTADNPYLVHRHDSLSVNHNTVIITNISGDIITALPINSKVDLTVFGKGVFAELGRPKPSVSELFQFLMGYAKMNEFEVIIPDDKGDESIDFININLKTKTIQVGDLNIEEGIL